MGRRRHHLLIPRLLPVVLATLAGCSAPVTPQPSAQSIDGSGAASTSASAPAAPQSTPSSTALAPTLLVRVDASGHIVDPVQTWLAATTTDGRYVWEWPGRRPGRDYRIRQLSDTGIERLRSELAAERAFDTGGQFELEPTGVEPPGFGRSWWRLDVGLGAAVVSVMSEVLQSGTERYFRHTPETRRLDELATSLTAPEAWLGPEAWAGPAEAFIPEDYLVWVRLTPFHAGFSSGTSFEDVQPPFDPRSVGDAVDPSGAETRCAILPASDIADFMDRVDAALDAEWATVFVDWPEAGRSVEITPVAVIAPATPACP